MSKKTLEQLKDIARKTSDEIYKIECAAVRAKNAPLIGKTFKTKNSYSCPKKRSDYWYKYAKVMRMDKSGMLFAFTFATSSHESISIERDECIYHAQYYKRIRATEFNRARARMIAKLRSAP